MHSTKSFLFGLLTLTSLVQAASAVIIGGKNYDLNVLTGQFDLNPSTYVFAAVAFATTTGRPGDNMGTHVATKTVDMAKFAMVNFASGTAFGSWTSTSTWYLAAIQWPDGTIQVSSPTGGGGITVESDPAFSLFSTSGTDKINAYEVRFNAIVGSNVVSTTELNVGSGTWRGSFTTTDTVNAATIVIPGTGTIFKLLVTSHVTLNGTKYDAPPADGTPNQLLATNGAGVLSWATDQTGAGGAADNLGTHVASKSIDGAGFPAISLSGVMIATTATDQALIYVATASGYAGPLMTLSTGASKVFEVTPASFTINASTVNISSTVIISQSSGPDGIVLIDGRRLGGNSNLLVMRGISGQNAGMSIVGGGAGGTGGVISFFDLTSQIGTVTSLDSIFRIGSVTSLPVEVLIGNTPRHRFDTSFRLGLNNVAPSSGLDLFNGSITVRGSHNAIVTSTYTVIGSTSGAVRNIFMSSHSYTGLQNYTLWFGSVAAIATGGTFVVTIPNVDDIIGPVVSDVSSDAESNQIKISAVSRNSFTIKNNSAINTKDVHWHAFAR